MQLLTDKSLKKSLTLINRLLAKSLNFSYVQVTITDTQEFVNYPDFQNTPVDLDMARILSETPNRGQIVSLNEHAIKGIPSAIKFHTNIPLTSSIQNTLGILTLLDTRERILSDEDISLIDGFAEACTDILEKHKENRRMQQVFTDFMHKAIHDLKNPLTSISLTSELLKRKADDAKMVVSFSERLEKANQRLFSNLEKLKYAFPVEDNSFKLVINEIDLGELLDEIKNSAKNINIITENRIDKHIYADYNRIKEVIILLIGDFSPNKSTDISIRSYSKEKQAIIAIASQSTNSGKDSTAFIVAKTLVDMHGGSIEIDENTYHIYLPSENL